VGFYTRGSRSARAAARRTGGRAFDDLAELARGADVLLVAVPDREVDAAARALASVARRGLVVAHLAGARGADALAAAARRGADAGAFHPIQTFPGSPLDSRRVRGAFVAIEGTRAARAALRRLALTLGMVPFELPATNRALYHASAVLASNAVVGLFDLAACAFAEATRLPRSKAEAALRPLLAATCQNLTRLPVPSALSGPVARGDAGTVKGHLAALAGADRRAARAYAVLGEQALDIALRKGTLTPAGARALRRILGRPRS
jgi:predicted short-subunit dehydrogenase-like oxidoreductase (DUF2520 family)